MKSRFGKTCLAVAGTLLLPFLSFAQGPDGVCDSCDAPIDSWLLILLAAGALYGFIKYRKQQKTLAK